jgi:hypothetical protein
MGDRRELLACAGHRLATVHSHRLARLLFRARLLTGASPHNAPGRHGRTRETIGNTLFDAKAPLWLVVRTHSKRRREFPELFGRPKYRHATVIHFRSPAAAETFLMEARGRSTPGLDATGVAGAGSRSCR